MEKVIIEAHRKFVNISIKQAENGTEYMVVITTACSDAIVGTYEFEGYEDAQDFFDKIESGLVVRE